MTANCDHVPHARSSGRSYVYLWSLLYGVAIDRTTPVYDEHGVVAARLRVTIAPAVASDEAANQVRIRALVAWVGAKRLSNAVQGDGGREDAGSVRQGGVGR